jgi:lipoate-protein ligase A
LLSPSTTIACAIEAAKYDGYLSVSTTFYLSMAIWFLMPSWRFLTHGPQNAATNMAIDESLLLSGTPTVRLYTWRPSALSIGYFQGIHEEVDVAACRREGVDIVRRISGGGAVYHDEHGEITYSLVAPVALLPANVQESCAVICSALVAGLNHLGLTAAFSPLNDVVANGKKISGSAQTRRNATILQHGTVLVDLDVDRMFSLLRVSQTKIADKGIKEAKERVTSLRHELGSMVERDRIFAALRDGFGEVFATTMVDGVLSEKEKERIPALIEKYASEQWTYQR